MWSRDRIGWAAIACGIAILSCRETKTPLAEVDPVVAGIERLGGVERLKAASSFSAGYDATLLGVTIKGKLQQKGGATRVEYVIPYGDRVVEVAAEEACWQRRGRVVIPCDRATRVHTSRLAGLLEASWLWPLKERRDRTVASESVHLGDNVYDGLTILGARGRLLGTLLMDRATSLAVGLKMETTLIGQAGEFSGTFTEVEQTCGVRMPTRREYTFSGRPYVTEKIGGVVCEAISDSVFSPPAQVKQGFVELKHKGRSILVCTKLKGPYSGVDAALGKVMAHITKSELVPMGAPALVHHDGPPRVKHPARFVTDVCLPVGKQAWLLPESVWQGEFFLRHIAADEVLAAFGLGDHVKTSTELPGLLLQGAQERKREPVGALVQILHTYGADIPPAQRVSEMHATLE